MAKTESLKISFDYVRAGWLGGHLRIGADRYRLLASWLVDTPRLLVNAAINVLDGRDARVPWIEEPNSVLWVLEPDAHVLRMTIARCGLLAPPDDWEPENGDDHVTTPKMFAWAVVGAMRELAISVSLYHYSDSSHWGSSFPTEPLQQLRSRL